MTYGFIGYIVISYSVAWLLGCISIKFNWWLHKNSLISEHDRMFAIIAFYAAPIAWWIPLVGILAGICTYLHYCKCFTHFHNFLFGKDFTSEN